MPKVVEYSLKTPRRAPEVFPDEVSSDEGERWVVLIGEGSDPDEVLSFLQELWPDVECEAA